MNVRHATKADEAVIRELWTEFGLEVPDPPGFESDGDHFEEHTYLAEENDQVVGILEASTPRPKRWHIELVHVRAGARKNGVATALIREFLRDARVNGADWVSLDVLETNTVAHAIWRKLGFEEVEYVLAQPLDRLERRLADAPRGDSRASIHVQSDDRTSVERAIDHFVPRLVAPDVRDAENGWIRIADTQLDANREAQGNFARELSHRLGAVVVALALEQGAVVRFRLYERGRMVDEYLSVPSFYGVISKGDELALAANPTLVARLTGADPGAVRRIARTAPTLGELPPADELYEQIGQLMGLES